MRGYKVINMTVYEEAIMNSKIESAENRIREVHNKLESQKVFGKKNYLPYKSENFIFMVNLFRDKMEVYNV